MFDRLGGLVGLVDVVCLYVCERFWCLVLDGIWYVESMVGVIETKEEAAS